MSNQQQQNNNENKQDWSSFPRKSLFNNKSNKNKQELNNRPYIEILIEKCELLPIRKVDKATSNPYLVLSCCHDAFIAQQKKLQSNVIKNSLDPIFNEVFEFEITPSEKEKGKIEETIAIQVWHKGNVFGVAGIDSFMGATNIPLNNLIDGECIEYNLPLLGVERGKIILKVIPHHFGISRDSNNNNRLSLSIPTLTVSDVQRYKTANNSIDVSTETRKKLKKIQQYKMIQKLEKGGFGTVYKVIDLEDKNNQLALQNNNQNIMNYKALKKIKCDSDIEANQAIQEVWYIRNLKHENLVSYDDMFLEFVEDEITKELKFNVCFVMPFYKDGDLDNLILKRRQQKKFFSVPRICSYLLQISKAIEHLHSKRIIHRDLKHKNVFLTDHYNVVKLGDFGFSRSISEKSMAYTLLGTVNYVAPEISSANQASQQLNGYTFSADIWSFGVMCYELITLNCGVKGFAHSAKALTNFEKYVEKITDDMKRVYGKYDDLIQFVVSLLRVNPMERPSAEECTEKLEVLMKKYEENQQQQPTTPTTEN
ncbi:hypothetical protein ABK040_014698 [Willaertia magna]